MNELEIAPPMSEEEFNALPNAEIRIRVATDVIQQLLAKKLTPMKGNYVLIPGLSTHLLKTSRNTKVQLKPLLSEFTCHVCAKGALFIADVMACNKYSVMNGIEIGSFGIKDKLNYFDRHQLNLIENAYECKEIEYSQYDTMAAIAFGKKYKTNINRMIGIMKNLIKNGGTFKP